MSEYVRHYTHSGAYVLLADSMGRVLLVHKSRGPYTGAWDLPGGKIEQGESPETAVLRELREETGLALPEGAALRSIAALSHRVEWLSTEGITELLTHIGAIFAASLPADAQHLPQPEPENGDSAEACWFSEAEARPLLLTPFTQRVLRPE